jgi:hypothetical protein
MYIKDRQLVDAVSKLDHNLREDEPPPKSEPSPTAHRVLFNSWTPCHFATVSEEAIAEYLVYDPDKEPEPIETKGVEIKRSQSLSTKEHCKQLTSLTGWVLRPALNQKRKPVKIPSSVFGMGELFKIKPLVKQKTTKYLIVWDRRIIHDDD